MTDERTKNRERMPTIAAVIDDFRRVFGPGVKLLYAMENGHEVGNRALHEEVAREFGREPA